MRFSDEVTSWGIATVRSPQGDDLVSLSIFNHLDRLVNNPSSRKP